MAIRGASSGLKTSPDFHGPFVEALEEAFARITNFLNDVPKHLLVVEDDEKQRTAIVELIAHEDVEITPVDSAEAALKQLSSGKHYDCVVLDLGLREMSGFDFLEKVKSNPVMSGFVVSGVTPLGQRAGLMDTPFAGRQARRFVGAQFTYGQIG